MDIQRGEVWWVSIDDSFGHEVKTGRPALVVGVPSEDDEWAMYTVCFLTAKPKTTGNPVRVRTYRCDSWVLCNQIRTLDANRFTKRNCVLTPEEMMEVDRALIAVLGLDFEPPDLEGMRVERDIYKALYERAVSRIATMQIEIDIGIRKMNTEAEAVKAAKAKPLVDINNCDIQELTTIGVPLNVARFVITDRPYENVAGLKRVPPMTDMIYEMIKGRVCCNPVVPKKRVTANINRDDGETISKKTGMPRKLAESIVSYREINGDYTSTDDIMRIAGIGIVTYNTYQDALEV